MGTTTSNHHRGRHQGWCAPQCNEARPPFGEPGPLKKRNPGRLAALAGSTQEGLAPMRATTWRGRGCFAQLTPPLAALPTVLGGR